MIPFPRIVVSPNESRCRRNLMPPRFLLRLQKKHIVLMRMNAKKARFAAMFVADMPSDEPKESCRICMEPHELVSIHHVDCTSTCTCKVHVRCLNAWQIVHEKKGVRIRICPACRTKRHEWQPPKRRAHVCGSHMSGGFCERPMGHLGPCA